MADFHMHTTHSDGNISVGKLLDEISEYGNKLFARTGKKFMFSITDHDSVAGVKEALGIIAKSPEKFRNVRFIPGVELSFSHKAPKSSNPCEISEVLAFGFDPFKLSKHMDALQLKRVQTIDNMFSEIKKALPLTNFDKKKC
ncbi:MAG: PHP domain-containing protein [Candidatus Gastranaerophilaceae bacterium]